MLRLAEAGAASSGDACRRVNPVPGPREGRMTGGRPSPTATMTCSRDSNVCRHCKKPSWLEHAPYTDTAGNPRTCLAETLVLLIMLALWHINLDNDWFSQWKKAQGHMSS